MHQPVKNLTDLQMRLKYNSGTMELTLKSDVFHRTYTRREILEKSLLATACGLEAYGLMNFFGLQGVLHQIEKHAEAGEKPVGDVPYVEGKNKEQIPYAYSPEEAAERDTYSRRFLWNAAAGAIAGLASNAMREDK